MSGQVHQDKQARRNEPPTPAETPNTGKVKQAQAASADTDDLLDEIDALLNEIGEDVVKNFEQVGGQ